MSRGAPYSYPSPPDPAYLCECGHLADDHGQSEFRCEVEECECEEVEEFRP